ncbi:MAG: hypothetical protein K2K86_07290 [Muribaculaceae bacterium]|nr:hypothetical protein [Muribaculaceae bacterium]
MDTYYTPTYNSKMLKTIFAGYAIVAALSSLFYIFQNKFYFNNIISIGFSITTQLISIALVGWAAIAGKRVGIKTLGRIAAWICLPLLLIIDGISIFQQILVSDSGFDYYEYRDLLQILSTTSILLLFLIAVSLTLMTIGSKLKILPMIAFIVTIWVIWCTNLSYTYWSYDLFKYYGENYFRIFSITQTVFWTASGVITLCFPTRE